MSIRRSAVVVVCAALCACSGNATSATSPTQSIPVATSAASTTTGSTPASTTTTAGSTGTTGAGVATSVVPWPGPCGRPGDPPARYDHVIWIWMENKNFTTVFDSSQAPFLHDLAAQCGAAAQFVDHGVRPSLANYVAATSGDTQGVHDDDPPAKHQLTVDNLFRQVRHAGLGAKSYQESMPSNCAQDSAGKYAVKHNPAAYYIGADDRAACQRDDVPFDQFATDLGGNLPAFSLITPDICNDMHDCSVSTGDAWLGRVVGSITSSTVFRQGKTAVFVVFDESQGSGTMPFVAVVPSIKPGTIATAELDHYSLLAFTEDALGISTHLGKAATAPSLAKAFGL